MDRAPQDLGDRECSFSSRRDDHDRIVKTRVLSLCPPESQCALTAAETVRRDSDGTRRSLLFEPRILVSFFFSWSSIQVLTPGQRGLPCPRTRPRWRRAPPAPRRPERAPLAHVVAVPTTATFVPRLPRAACSRGLEAHTRVPRDSRTPRRLVPSARVTEERSGTGWASTWSVSSARKLQREPPGSEARRLVPAGGAAKPRVPSLAPAQDPRGSCVPPAPCTWRTRRLGIYQKDKRLARSVRRRGRHAVPGAGGGRKRFPG